MAKKGVSRRKFLGQAVGAATAFTIVPRHVLGGNGSPPPSEKINHAVIGTGGMGRGHVGYALRDKKAALVAVCDVDAKHLGLAMDMAKKAGQACQGYKDFREVLDRGDIDVVHVPTPPHWHALVSIAAADAGCDVWCEKPMTRTIGEGQHVIDAIQRNGRVFRLNTWFRFSSNYYGFGASRDIKKLLLNGCLGWPVKVRVSRAAGFNWKVKQWSGHLNDAPQPVPKELDFDFWLGPAPVKPYTRHRTHSSFRGYWDYDGGGLADMGQHYLDPVQYFLGKDDTSPVEIKAYAPWPAHPDACDVWGRVDLKYEDGCHLILESGEWGKSEPEGQPFIEGPKGKIFKGFRLEPESLYDAVAEMPDPPPMISDFNQSIVTRQKFGLNESNGNRSNILVHLANCAIRTGRTLRFDPKTQRFIGDEEANRLADQPMRAPWHL